MITVTATHKPPQVVAEATAQVAVVGGATWDEVVDAGLRALGESRSSLFGYGVREAGEKVQRTLTPDGGVTRWIGSAVLVVYAYRD